MSKRVKTRLLITLGILIVCVYLIGGFPPSLANMENRIRLGLDLKGGTRLVLEVVTEDAIRAETNRTIENLRNQLQQDSVTVRQINRTQDDQFTAVGVDPARDADFRRLIADLHPEWEIVGTDSEVPNTYMLKLNPLQAGAYREQAVDQAINTIQNRIDQLGLAEAVVTAYGSAGEHQILVQFPGVSDPNEVKGIIQQTALLKLKLVEGQGVYPSQAAAIQQYGGMLPANLEVLPSQERADDGTQLFYVVQRTSGVTGRDLRGAFVSRDQYGRPQVSFILTPEGAQRFGRLTEQNIGRQLAIVLDGRIVSAPVIQSRIADEGVINGGEGGFTQDEAQNLALVLRSGALPASMNILHEQVVGPSLGADSIRQGVIASIVGLATVVVLVLFYYRGAGVNATIAIFLNLLILLAAMAYFGAALTLPGIAGIILTVGVGIDSNVLIFERIREELRAGKTAVSAVATSFKRVFITLVDTHLAALISATFLFLFGAGAVKGFAVTLVIGLISNMFTSVFVSRTLFELVLSRKGRAEGLSI